MSTSGYKQRVERRYYYSFNRTRRERFSIEVPKAGEPGEIIEKLNNDGERQEEML